MVALAAVLALGFGGTLLVDGQTSDDVETHAAPGPEPTPAPPAYAAGELIIKLNDEAGQQLEEALEAGRPLTETGLAWLDALNATYGVSVIEPVFRHQADPEEIREKYPERARRASPGVTIPSLRYIYQLTVRADADIRQAVAEFSQQPAVIYAEPNYVATIQDDTIELP
jgi:hypothetical protein